MLVFGALIYPWKPAGPSVYQGLDRNLIYVEAPGSASTRQQVAIGPDRAVLMPSASRVSIHLLSSENAFSSDFDVVVRNLHPAASGTTDDLPLRIRVWHPSIPDEASVVFSRDRTIVMGNPNSGDQPSVVGTYLIDAPYHLHVEWQQGRGGSLSVAMPTGRLVTNSVDRSSGSTLITAPWVDLSLDSSASRSGSSAVEVKDFRLAIPSRTLLAAKTDDPRVRLLTFLLIAWLLAYLANGWVQRRRANQSSASQPGARSVFSWVGRRRRQVILFGSATIAIVALYGALAFVDAHPYDRLSQESWAYVVDQYGLGALYDRTNAIPDAAVRGGHAPWSSTGFAYLPGMAYPYYFVGKVWHFFHGPIAPLHDRPFQAFWKFLFASFILVVGGLIYYLAVRVNQVRTRVGLIAAGFLVLSPAVVFDAAVWGESDAILSAALLLVAVGFLRDKPKLGWSALIISLLLKQTALFIAPAFVIFAARKFGVRRSLIDACFGSVVGFVFISPAILAGYHPNIAYMATVAQFKFFALPESNWVSGDTFSVWTLFTGFHGLHGFDRLWPPYPIGIAGINLSLGTLGSILFAAVVLIGLVLLWRAPIARLNHDALFSAAALFVVANVLFSTKASARYLTLALPFLLLSFSLPLTIGKLRVPSVLSAISFISMYGLFAVIAVRQEWPNFYGIGNPSNNALTAAIYRIYTSDSVITISALLLVGIAGALLVALFTGLNRNTAVQVVTGSQVRQPELVRENA